MITTEFKTQVVTETKKRLKNYTSANKMAVALGISAAQFSRIINGDLENVLSDANWISIARKLDMTFGNRTELVTANTETFAFVTAQLKACQEQSLSGMLCDEAGIGKTYAAKYYVKSNKNAVYIDCSQVKSRQKLVREIAKEFGVNHTAKYSEVYADLRFYLHTAINPLIILDEAGDLEYTAFLELKALWNATENVCGWYMMGADGLKAKIEGNLNRKKIGYAELFRRYGEKFQKVTPDGKDAREEFNKRSVAMVAKANGINDIQTMYAKTKGSLSRLAIEIQKMKRVA